MPSAVERPFRIALSREGDESDVVLTGRIDRVDEGPGGTVLVDYKTAEIDDEEEAEKRAKEDLQLSVYALAWREMTGRTPERVELRWLTTGRAGAAAMTASRLEKTRAKIAEIATAIRAGSFPARPREYACRRCPCRPICPDAAV